MCRSPWSSVILAIILLLVLVAAASAVVTTGMLEGVVTDAQSGQPLAGVNIRIEGTALTTVTDADGRYVITNVPPGTYNVSCSLVGYGDAVSTGVAVMQEESRTTDFALEPTVLEVTGAEAKVTAAKLQVRPAVTATAYTITAHEEQVVRTQPMNMYQFPGLVGGQPGVVDDSTGYPHIRGAREDQFGYMLEGIPLVEPNNNVFATNIVTVGLDRAELFTGGYPASYPGYVGGVVNEVVKRGDQVNGGFVDLSLGSPWDYRNLIFERGAVNGAWNWYVQGITWASEFHDSNFTKSAPVSSDAIAKAIYTIGPSDQLTLLANHGYARYLFPFEHSQTFDPATGLFAATAETTDFGRQGYDLDAATWSHTLSPKAFFNVRAYRLQNWIRLDLSSDQQGFWQDRRQTMQGLLLNYNGQIAPRHMLYSGLWNIWSDNNLHAAGLMSPIFPAVLEYEANNDTYNLQGFVGDRWRATDKLTLDLGVRYDHMTYDREPASDLELSEATPRAGATYALSNSLLLRGSWGQYAQMPGAKYTHWSFIDRGLMPTVAESPFAGMTQGEIWPLLFSSVSNLEAQVDTTYDLGLEARLAPKALLDISYFHRDSDHMLQRWYGDSDDVFDYNGTKRYASNGHGLSRGVETKLRRPLANNWEGWISYTYMTARATSSNAGAFPMGLELGNLDNEYYVPWDQRHTLSLVSNHKVGKWEFSPSMTYGSGYAYWQSGSDLGGSDSQHVTMYTGEGVAYDVPILVNGDLQPTDPNSLRTGSHWMCGLTMRYHMTPDHEVYVSLYNLLGNHNATNLAWYDGNTGSILSGAYHPPTTGEAGPGNTGYITYVPYTYNSPFYAAFGMRFKF